MDRLKSLWLDLPLAYKGIIVATLPVVTVLLAAVPIVLNEIERAKMLDASVRTHVVSENAETALRRMQEAEKAVFGFILTNDSTHLADFREAHDSALATIRIMDPLIRDSVARDAFRDVRTRIGNMHADLEREIELAPQRTLGTPQMQAMLVQERKTTQGLRDAIDALIAAEDKVREGQFEQLADTQRKRNYLAGLVFALGLMASGFSAVLFVSGISTRVDRLQDAATRSGLPGTGEIPVAGEDELGQLSIAIEENLRNTARTADRLKVAIRAARIEVIELRPDADELTLIGSGNVFRRLGYSGTTIPTTLSAFINTIHEEDRARVASALSNPTPGWEYEVEFRMHTGEHEWHWMDLRGAGAAPEARTEHGPGDTPHPGHQPGVGLGVLLDVTERKVAEEQVRVALTAADRANRAKSDFVSRMSHELRTPLNAVLGFAQLLEIDELTADQRESVSHILRGGRYLLDLINEVLDLARIEAGRFAMSIEPISMREVVGAVVALIGPQAAEFGVRLYFPPPPFNSYASADRHRLKQVLLNLLSNAIKYNRRGGSVEVGLERGFGKVRVLVTDTGPGITDDELDRLFQPFERLEAAKSGVEGTGLGLALSRSIVEAMGGRIIVESRIGAGSTFTVELPEGEAPDDDLESAERDGRATMTIVYVEDNQANVRLVERVVGRRPGMRLVTLGDGERALEIVRAENPSLVLLDLNLPGLSGDAILAQLRANPATAEIPVAIMTADATQSQIDRLHALGAQYYFTKPIDVGRLLQLLDDVAAGITPNGA